MSNGLHRDIFIDLRILNSLKINSKKNNKIWLYFYLMSINNSFYLFTNIEGLNNDNLKFYKNILHECITYKWNFKFKKTTFSFYTLKNTWSQCILASIKNNQSLGPLFVHYTVSTFSASDGISRPDFIFMVAFSTNVHHRSF